MIDKELELIEIDKIRKNYFREKARESKKKRKLSLNGSTQSSNFEGERSPKVSEKPLEIQTREDFNNLTFDFKGRTITVK